MKGTCLLLIICHLSCFLWAQKPVTNNNLNTYPANISNLSINYLNAASEENTSDETYVGNKHLNAIGIFTSSFYSFEHHSIDSKVSSSGNIEDFIQLLTLQYGIYYSRKISRNIGLGITYSLWNRNIVFGTEDLIKHPREPGRLHFRYNYQMIDLLIIYNLDLHKNHKHTINFAIGPSVSRGKNSHLLFYYTNPSPPHDVQYGYTHRNASYVGFVSQIGYDYSFINHRLFLGANLRGRYYNNRPYQGDVDFHIGIRF